MRAADTSLRALSRQLRAGKISALALVEQHLDRIAGREAEVQAWAWLDPEAARAAARALDAAPVKHPLHGMAVGIKDIFDTADMPTQYGSPIYAHHRPVADCAAVAQIRAAGGLILGKTVTCEFAGAQPAGTRNPHNSDHAPGGSSSGSAAAVGAGMLSVALGTQTAGSIICPASFCGVVGYKPSFGMIDRAGVKPLSDSVDTVGFFAATIDDAGWFAGTMTGRADLANDTPLSRPPRLLLCRTDAWDHADADGQTALETAVRRLTRRGALVTEGVLPFSCIALMAAGLVVIGVEARRALAYERDHAPQLISGTMTRFLTMADDMDRVRYDNAQAEREHARAAMADLLDGYDALITLSATGEAPRGLDTIGNASFAFPWTLAHVPAVSVPGLVGARGLPIGIQFVGRRRDDATLLKVARWAETALREA